MTNVVVEVWSGPMNICYDWWLASFIYFYWKNWVDPTLFA
jgi:hypothetical protein